MNASGNDFRQVCLKLWVFGSALQSQQLLSITSEDTFWGVFHMIKKLLLAKRKENGELENDLFRMYEDNRIGISEAESYLFANLPDYTRNVDELSLMLDSLCDVELMRDRGVSSDTDRKGVDNWQSRCDATRFLILAYTPAVYLNHPTSLHRSYSPVKSASFYSLYSHIQTNRALLRDIYDQEIRPNGHYVSFSDFIEFAPSVVYSLHRELFEEMGGKVSPGLIPVEEFVENYSIFRDVDRMKDWTLEQQDDPIVD